MTRPPVMIHAIRRTTPRAFLLLSVLPAAALAQLPAASSGASVFVIDSAEIAASNARTLTELLAARVPGLSVMRDGGSAAEGASVRMRGVHSFVVPTTPVLVVDGVRVSSRQATSTIGSAVESSEIDELLPEDIARIEVLRGPAAAASFGPGAADGVIVVTTKSGGPGPLALRARTDAGLAMKPTRWPSNYAMNGIVNATGQPTDFCLIFSVTDGYCTPTTLSQFNPLRQASPFRVERTADAHFGAAGGRGGGRAYLGASAERTDGVLDGDDLRRLGARARASQALPFGLSIDASGGVLRDDGHIPNLAATIGAGLLGSAHDDSLHGYLPATLPVAPPQQRRLDRAMGAATLRWRPIGWLDAAFVAGADRVNGREDGVEPYVEYLGTSPPRPVTVNAAHDGWRHDDVRTARATLAASWHLRTRLVGRTSVAYDRYTYRTSTYDSLALSMSGFVTFLGRHGLQARGSELDQQLVWDDRVSVDAGLRRAGPAPFGGAAKRELYPWANASWSVGGLRAVSDLRLRAAYGEAAIANPDVPVDVTGGVIAPAPPPRAERTRETELGVDTRFGDRGDASVTAFRATSSNLLVIVPPGPFMSQVGSMRNSGVEVQVNGRVLQRGGVRWDATVTLATLRNRVLSIGDVPQIVKVPAPFVTSTLAPGHPLGSWWARPYTWADTNGDHMIAQNELHIANPTVFGSAMPTTEAALRSGLTLPHGISANLTFDYRGGYQVRDVNEATRCSGYVFNCRGAQDPSAPLADQAAAMELLQTSAAASFIEDASFLRLRELSLAWSPAARSRLAVAGISRLSVVGRDLATFTRYRGVDPEITAGAPGQLPRYDFEKLPILPTVLLRVDLGGRVGN